MGDKRDDSSVIVNCEEVGDDFKDIRRKFSLRATLPEVEDDDYIERIRKYNRAGPHIIEGFTPEGNLQETGVRRLIHKSGKYNVTRKTESSIAEKYLRDFFNTLVSGKWWKIILAASSVFILCWLTFAVVWMLISNSNGDLEANQFNPCITGVQHFAGYFLLSLETQVSIGYGTRSLTDQCLEAAFVLCIQLIIGIFLCGVTVNVVFMKLVKPSSRFRHNLFSKHAVICRHDGYLCLMFRVRDEEYRHSISTTITAYILRKDSYTKEPYLEQLNLEPHGFLIWPLEIIHRITPQSPLWDISSYNLISDKFEIIATIQGSSATTGQCSKTRTSYVSSEILWGHKFKNCIKYNETEAMYNIQRKNFNTTIEKLTYLCSAKKFREVYDNSLTPTPTSMPKNFNFKENDTNEENKRQDALMPTELKAFKEVEKKEDEEPLLAGTDESNSNFKDYGYHQTPIISNTDDSWMKESKSMPSIREITTNYPNLGYSKNYNSYADTLIGGKLEKQKTFQARSGNKHRIFEEEQHLYETGYLPSSQSIDYPKSDAENEPEVDLHTLISSLEDYLDKHSSCGNSNLSLFPKDI